MKIIHCSDLHLDSRLEANLPPEKARERAAELCGSFMRLVSFAEDNGVRVVMIVGDLFDTDRASAATAGLVLSRIRQAKGIDFLYLRGNHDEGAVFRGFELPENLKTFSNTWSTFRYDGVCIAGAEPDASSASGIYDALNLRGNETNIVMLHGQESTQSGEGLVCLPALRGRGINYLALGHLHSYKKERLDMDGEYCYCGCLEGRGFDECGEKGFVLLDADRGGVAARFVPFAYRRLHEFGVDISGLDTVSEIREAMERSAADVPERDMVKFTLRGSYTLGAQKDLRYLSSLFAARYYFIKIKDESRLAMDRSGYQHDISLKGEFIRLVMASELPEEDKERIICLGVGALSGEGIEI